MIGLGASRKRKTVVLLLVVLFFALTPAPPVARAAQTTFYVDSINGADANSGTSQDSPWQTFAPVHARDFQPGDTIHLRCGSTWDGGLVIDDSGVEGNPITFKSYGTGARPTIRNPGVNYGRAVEISANWVLVEGLLVRDAHEAGVLISRGADHNIVRNCEATNAGRLVAVEGQYNLITQNYAHDLTMVRNTEGGDDDYGAVGVSLLNSNNEVSYNAMVNCIAPSYDYGSDGGAVELYGQVDNSYIHHNWARGCDGFMEVGGGSSRDTVVAYNVAVDNNRFGTFHMGGNFETDVQNFRIENNTIVETGEEEMNWAVMAFCNGVPTADAVILRNNIIHADRLWYVANVDGFTHEHNLYHLASPDLTALGFELQEGEQLADMLFADLAGHDLRLQSESPAIDTGIYLGHPLDYDGQIVPLGSAPDMGAYEYATGSPSPTPTATPTAEPDELIIDDGDSGFSTSFSQDSWVEHTAVAGPHYGDTHYYNRQMGSGLDTATWSFTVSRPGTYNVYAWWWEGSWRPTDVPYTIHHLGGSTTVRANQQTNGGQWNLLGAFDFQDQGSVVVSDDTSSEQRDIVADAIRLAYVGPSATPSPTPAPTATPTPDPLTVAAVSPNYGPASEATSVTITGSGFQAGATVTFGGAACDDSTVNSASEIVCTAPPHLPMVVDVTVTNPDGESDVLSRGFTYQGTTALLSLPESHGAPATTILVPVNAADVQGLVAADLKVTFDADVLSARGASVGDLTSVWNVAADITGPGEVWISLASPDTAVTGSGTLALLEFDIVGQHGSASALHLASASLNDGAIPVESTDGSFATDLFAVFGTVRYWNGNGGVPNVLLSNEGEQLYSDHSDPDGAFTVMAPSTGTWHLNPTKSGEADAISAYDASLVLQHAAGIITLSDYAAMAADVNGSGTINSMDAYYILQKTVDLISLPFPGSGAVWAFDPPSRSYANLTDNQSGQDFTAVLLGDVSGNWGAAGEASASAPNQPPATLSVVGGEIGPSGLATATLRLDAGQAPVYSLEVVVAYSPDQATALSIQPGPLCGNLAMSHDLTQAGEVRLALASDSPISAGGDLLTMSFQMADPAKASTQLFLTRGEINEGSVPVHLSDGRLGREWRIYLPMTLNWAAQ